MHRNRSVSSHQFAMVPRAEIPRSSFRMQKTLKTTFDSGYLNPIFCEEILPGDSWSLSSTAFCRLSTPITPFMDNLYFETFYFFVPARLLWTNWERFMGSQDNPGDGISYTIPQIVSPAGGFTVGSIYDLLGLPTVGQVAGGNTISINALPLRAYNLIWNDWFRDENLQNSVNISSAGVNNPGDGPDNQNLYTLLRRGKRHDYFTGCLPAPQKGSSAVSLPLGTSAPIKSLGGTANFYDPSGSRAAALNMPNAANTVTWSNSSAGTTGSATFGPLNTVVQLYADLSTATAATINQLRQAFQIQRLLERDARGGTRYTEIVRAHFGVMSPDARLQRPEYLGGGSSPIVLTEIPQTSATGLTGGSAPLGQLAAKGTVVASGHGFRQSFTEHGYVLGLANVRADLTYQQGLQRKWTRLTRYDFYFPVFAMLGEQAVLNKEIYCDGSANDANVFGYQERWAEYRYLPSQIVGKFRSTSAGTIDMWHLSQKFTALPTLNTTFIQDTPPVSRVIAAGSGDDLKQFLCDIFFDCVAARPMPLYSVPGLIDHF